MKMVRKSVESLGLRLSLLSALAMLVAASPVRAQNVNVDYDHKAPFSDYRTYAWIRPPQLRDPLMAQHVMDAINQQLDAKGLQQASDSAGADIGIVANGATQEKHTLQTFYDNFGGWGWMGWDGMATTQEQTYEVGTLVVDMFDTKSKQVIWRGTATDTLSDKAEKNAEKLNKAVEKMMKDFPPKRVEH
jgi:Domain of unknown function (DUF4136)